MAAGSGEPGASRGLTRSPAGVRGCTRHSAWAQGVIATLQIENRHAGLITTRCS